MSKDNLFLGMARGSVGDVTFSRLNGVQVARARNRAPHNPQSPAQMVQRIIMSTVGKAYSFMQSICNHSFEGFETGQLSQRKFMELNVALLRDRAADVLAYPVESIIKTSDAFNFNFKNDYAPVLNGLQVSAGSLPSLVMAQTETTNEACIECDFGEITTAEATYQDVINVLGLQRGDQLTFIQVSHDSSKAGHERDLLTGFRYARVILEPASGDMTTKFFGNNTVNNPNERNEGDFLVLALASGTSGYTGIQFRLKDITITTQPDKHAAGATVIVSRQSNGVWRRSTQFLMPYIKSGPNMLNSSTLGLAYETYLIGTNSDLYLNQAQ